jgi:phosphoribosyl-AMP cyclohydrolase
MAAMSQGAPITADPELLASIRFDDHGLVPAIAQDVATGAILMMAWMNAETLQLTLDEGRMVYWSRSRKEIWRKGETSGEVQIVHEGFVDCDADVLLFKVTQQGGGACHTGAYSCFFRSLDGAVA